MKGQQIRKPDPEGGCGVILITAGGLAACALLAIAALVIAQLTH